MRLISLTFNFIFYCYAVTAQPAMLATGPQDAATVRALYHLTFQPDSLTPEKKLQEDFTLLISKNTSLFVSANRPKRDSSIAKINDRLGSSPGMVHISLADIPKTWFSFYIYKNYVAQTLTTFEAILTKNYRIEESSAGLRWRFLPDTQRVAGYACQRATVDYGGRHWLAWFTREVPISDGPYKFSGLPGLIVQVQDAQGFYIFDLASLTALRNGPAIALLTWPTRPATREQMRQTMYSYKRNPFAFMSGPAMDGTEQQTYHEQNKTRNNAIERH
jgi:GLPGLI family protein